MTETKQNENKTVFSTEFNGIKVARNVGTMHHKPNKPAEVFDEPISYDSYTLRQQYNGKLQPVKLNDETLKKIIDAYEEAKAVKVE